MPIYAGSFGNYEHIGTFWYMTPLVKKWVRVQVSEWLDCHPTNSETMYCVDSNFKINLISVF
jgi:hypothetical protein